VLTRYSVPDYWRAVGGDGSCIASGWLVFCIVSGIFLIFRTELQAFKKYRFPQIVVYQVAHKKVECVCVCFM